MSALIAANVYSETLV